MSIGARKSSEVGAVATTDAGDEERHGGALLFLRLPEHGHYT